MSFRLDQVVPWGRNLAEYAAMFSLGPGELAGRILGCGDGPACFNAELHARGGRAVSADPLYVHGPEAIRARINATFDQVMEQTRRNMKEFVWRHLAGVEELGQTRMAAMDEFLAHFASQRRAGRYVAASLPHLPFADQSFDLALCSHFLFLYSERHDADFHLGCVEEMCRVARQARVFPLLELGAKPSPHLDAVVGGLEKKGYGVEVRRVDYEFQRGGNEMLVAWLP